MMLMFTSAYLCFSVNTMASTQSTEAGCNSLTCTKKLTARQLSLPEATKNINKTKLYNTRVTEQVRLCCRRRGVVRSASRWSSRHRDGFLWLHVRRFRQWRSVGRRAWPAHRLWDRRHQLQAWWPEPRQEGLRMGRLEERQRRRRRCWVSPRQHRLPLWPGSTPHTLCLQSSPTTLT